MMEHYGHRNGKVAQQRRQRHLGRFRTQLSTQPLIRLHLVRLRVEPLPHRSSARPRRGFHRAASRPAVQRAARGVTIEEIAHLVGHGSTSVTERVYRKELRPVITRGARAINELFDGDTK
jgi:hypothetical protein